MKPVWEWLNAKSVQDKDLPRDFFVLANVLPQFWEQTSKTPTKEAMRNLKKMEDRARQLAKELREREAEIRLMCGYGTSLHALIAEMHCREGRDMTAKELRELDDKLYLAQGEHLIPNFADVLEALAEKLARAERGQLVNRRPTKPNEVSAERTYCVQSLASFFEERVGEISLDAIARIVNEILDIGGTTPLDASHVGKLLKR